MCNVYTCLCAWIFPHLCVGQDRNLLDGMDVVLAVMSFDRQTSIFERLFDCPNLRVFVLVDVFCIHFLTHIIADVGFYFFDGCRLVSRLLSRYVVRFSHPRQRLNIGFTQHFQASAQNCRFDIKKSAQDA